MLKNNLSRGIIYFFYCLSILFVLSGFRQDTPHIDFLDLSFKKAMKLSKQQHRPTFVFVSTDHCDICVKTKVSFLDPQVVEFYNSNFVSIKLDPDNIANNFRISAWDVNQTPGFIFLEDKKMVLFKSIGYQSPASLISLGNEALKKHKELQSAKIKKE
jgi:thioredoxin-related protein